MTDYSADMDAADLRKQQLIGAQRNNALQGLVYQGQVQDNQDKQSDNALIRASHVEAKGNQDVLLGILRVHSASD